MPSHSELRQAGADLEFEQSAQWLESHVSAECAMRYRAARRPIPQPDSSESADAIRLRWLLKQQTINTFGQVDDPEFEVDDLLNSSRAAIDASMAAQQPKPKAGPEQLEQEPEQPAELAESLAPIAQLEQKPTDES
jgi:hypothetical protein